MGRKGIDWNGFNAVFNAGQRVTDAYLDDRERRGLADAQNKASTVEADPAAQQALADATRARQMDDAMYREDQDNTQGPVQYDQSAVAGLRDAESAARDGVTYKVGGKTFRSQEDAEAAVPGLRDAAAIDFYRSQGKVDKANKYQADAIRNEASALALKGAKRDDALAEQGAPLRAAMVEHEINTWPQKLRVAVMNGEIGEDEARRAVANRFVSTLETLPERASGWLKNGTLAEAFPEVFKGAVDLSREGNNLKVTYEDGTSRPLSVAQVRAFAGGSPLDVKELSAGAKLIGIDKKTGKASVLAEGNPRPDTADHSRTLVNDGVNQLALAYGAKLDPIGKMLDTGGIKDKTGYQDDIAALERRVRSGENPMSVASDLAAKARRRQAEQVVAPAPANPSPSSLSHLWSGKK